jgi:hypothetical protein
MKPVTRKPDPGGQPRIVIVGAGFAGFHCARALDRRLGSTAELMLVNPVDHMVYSALLPEVVGCVVDPRCVATPLAPSLPSTRVLIWRSVCQVSSIECPPRCCRLGVGETCCSGGEASGEVLDVGQSHMRGLATPGPWLRRWLTRV